MRTVLGAAFIWVLSIGFSTTAEAENRIALVIGNSAYADAPLKNPKNDAALMADTLKQVGFEVIQLIDVDQKTMKRAMVDFGRRLRGSDSVGLFYYAGHGVQVEGENFLIPIGAAVHDELEVAIEGVSVNDFLRTMKRASSRINIVVLDACRNNPFARSYRSSDRGLARVDAPKGTYVAYATSPGSIALDGDTGNSPYTAALSKAIVEPGLAIEQVFKQARREVLAATREKQTPWEASSIVGRFYFKKLEEPKPTLQVQTKDNQGHELAFWNTIKDLNEPKLYADYLHKYPNGSFVELARFLRKRAEKSIAEEPAKRPVELVPTEPEQVSSKPADASKPEEQRVAVLEPTADVKPEPVPDLPRKIQKLLADAGCNPGKVDGAWGRNSKAALERFARYAKVVVPEEPLSAKTLKLFEGHEGRVCPLDCGPRQTEKNGRCVAKTCKDSQVLSSVGECVANARLKQQAASLTGRWTLRSKCNTGNFTVILSIHQKSPGTFGGRGHGITSGYDTVIQNGRISGNKVTFSRRNVSGGPATATHTAGTLSADGRRMSGTERGILWTCTFTAQR